MDSLAIVKRGVAGKWEKRKKGDRMPADWVRIRAEYVSGSVTLRELSEKYGVPQSTIRKHAASECWRGTRTEQQEQIQAQAEQKTIEKISELLSEEAAARVRIRAKLIHMAENWINKQEGEISETGDFRRIVQSCIDLGIMGMQESEVTEDDGLIEALGKSAQNLFEDGDDSDTLPEVGA